MTDWVQRRLRRSGVWPAIRPLARTLGSILVPPREKSWRTLRGAPPPPEGVCIDELSRVPSTGNGEMRAVLYRIIGNDIPGRHGGGQSLSNLRFILDHEPELERCEKRWIVNRIVDPPVERSIVALLEKRGQPLLRIPYDQDVYDSLPLDTEGAGKSPFWLPSDMAERRIQRLYRHWNNYAINNNGARNTALEDGRSRARWILPWDGNCYLTREAWDSIRAVLDGQPSCPYFVVPMARIGGAEDLLRPGAAPAATDEPQIIFRHDARETFNSEYYYGRRPKVELLWRLGVPGPWDHWYRERWDLPYPRYAPDAGAWRYAGWVARLPSGKTVLDTGRHADRFREEERARATRIFLETLRTR